MSSTTAQYGGRATTSAAAQGKQGFFPRTWQWIKTHPAITLLIIIALVSFGLLIVVLGCSCAKTSCALGDERPANADAAGVGVSGGLGVTGVYGSPTTGAGANRLRANDGRPCPPMATEYAPHSDLVPPSERATQGADQPHMNGHPIEQQARAVHRELYNHPDLPCFEPRDACYDPAQALLTEAPTMVPPYQQRLKALPAMRQLNLQQENAATGFGQNARQGIDTMSSSSFDSQNTSDADSLGSRIVQTAGAPDDLAGIYGVNRTKGISMINQKSRTVDPTKMLPRADPSQEQHRMVQAGPSIADIGCRVPKAADLMRMMRGGSSVLSQTIPRDKPPLYTEGLNAFRPTRLPARTVQGDCLFGISPLEVSDVIDYRPNCFLYGSRGYGAPYAYAVPGAAAV